MDAAVFVHTVSESSTANCSVFAPIRVWDPTTPPSISATMPGAKARAVQHSALKITIIVGLAILVNSETQYDGRVLKSNHEDVNNVIIHASGAWVNNEKIAHFDVDDLDTAFVKNGRVFTMRSNRAAWTDTNRTLHLIENDYYYTYKHTHENISACAINVFVTDNYISAAGSFTYAVELIQASIAAASSVYYSATGVGLGIRDINVWNTGHQSPNIADTLNSFTSDIAYTDGCVAILFDNYEYNNNYVGIAWMDGACGAHYHGVVSTLDVAATAMVLAHEVGHLQGASHVEMYPSCASQSTIMAADISHSVMLFSNCVKEELRAWAADGCVTSELNYHYNHPHYDHHDDDDIALVAGLLFFIFLIVVCFSCFCFSQYDYYYY